MDAAERCQCRPNKAPARGATTPVDEAIATTAPVVGEISSIFPLPALTASRSPPGARASPSGTLTPPPRRAVAPWSALGAGERIWYGRGAEGGAVGDVQGARGIEAIPVGPMTSAAGLVRSASPVAPSRSETTCGSRLARPSPRRRTVLRWTTRRLRPVVPLRTLLTKGWPGGRRFERWRPTGVDAVPRDGSRTFPWLLRINRHPTFAVAAVPFTVGGLPITTQPERSTTRAVVRPIPPGQRPGKRWIADLPMWADPATGQALAPTPHGSPARG